MDESTKPREPLYQKEILQEMNAVFNCAICRSPLKKPVQVKCGHVYCSHCLKGITKSSTSSNCPLCQKKIPRRPMVERNDIESMLALVQRLTETFNREITEYIREQTTSLHELSPPPPVVPLSLASPPPPELYDSRKEMQIVPESKNGDKLDKLEKMKKLSQQPYIIMTSSVVPESSLEAKRHASETALDLSAKCKSSQPVNYIYKETIRFVKPMDLSIQKKRKLEVASDFDLTSSKTLSPFKSTNPAPLKKSKTLKASQYVGMGKPLNLSSTESISSRSSRSIIENENTDFVVKTSSDEMLGNLSEDALINAEQPPRETRANTKKGKESKIELVKNNQEAFVFKQPTMTVTQATQSPTRKKKSNSSVSRMNNSFSSGNTIVQQITSDFDDELRDSDLLFLRINDNEVQSGTTPLEPTIPSEKEESNDVNMTAVDTNKGNTSQVLPKSRTGTPVQSTSRLTRSRNTPISNVGKVVNKTHHRQDTNDLFGDVTWVDDAFSSNESLKNSKSSPETVVSHEGSIEISNKFNPKRYVFCPTRLTKDQMLKLQQLCTMCNGVISREYTPDVTHLIINLASGRVPQTLKYLLAIAGRKWVVIYDWVEKCVTTGSVVSEEIFETSNFKQCDPGVKRSRLATKDLFKNIKFYFATETFRNMGYSFEDVLKLMTALGAEVIPSTDDLNLPCSSELIIIGDRTANATEYYNWFLTHDWITVTFNWILDCILEYKLVHLSAKYLCIDIGEEEINVASCALQSQFFA